MTTGSKPWGEFIASLVTPSRDDLDWGVDVNLPKDYYVYIHRKPDNTVFYVGKGSNRRAWDTCDRNRHWRNTVRKYGYYVEIVQDGLQEWAALELEVELIAYHGRKDLGNGGLVNLTDGGECEISTRSKEKMSEDGRKAGLISGRKQLALGVNIHAQTIEDRVRMGRAAVVNKTGIHGLSDIEIKANSLKGVARRLEMIRTGELKLDLEAMSVRSSSVVKVTNTQVWKCSCGYEDRACGVGLHQKRTGHSGKERVK